MFRPILRESFKILPRRAYFENLSKTTTAKDRKEKIIAQRSQAAAEDEIGGQKESKRSPDPTY